AGKKRTLIFGATHRARRVLEQPEQQARRSGRRAAGSDRERTMTFRKRRNGASPPFDDVAGNGLLNRRALLGRGIMLAGAAGTGVGASIAGAAAEPLKDDPWSLQTGETIPPLQVASRFEKHVV